MPIHQWNDIKDEFQDGLLLGNGASMAVHQGFGYRSLYEAAQEKGHLPEEVAQVFLSFGVHDFELVLRRLWHAKVVNEALGIQAGRVEEAYLQVRNSLIATIRDIHISHADALPHLRPIYEYMMRFKTVVSLNYDLLVYWAAMHSQDNIGIWFKDCFVNGRFSEDWADKRRPYRAEGATLYFYPHGNLALARGRNDEEYKIASNGADLLTAVLGEWEAGRGVPLFVCEGTTEHKVKSIANSEYLQRVAREVLPAIGTTLVIYGWGMGDQEDHILSRLQQAECQRVAISVYGGNEEFMVRAQDKLRTAGIRDVLFFDSQSPGCWNNPPAPVG
jgi:hypothetical protein